MTPYPRTETVQLKLRGDERFRGPVRYQQEGSRAIVVFTSDLNDLLYLLPRALELRCTRNSNPPEYGVVIAYADIDKIE